jgi:hypothetical protein
LSSQVIWTSSVTKVSQRNAKNILVQVFGLELSLDRQIIRYLKVNIKKGPFRRVFFVAKIVDLGNDCVGRVTIFY